MKGMTMARIRCEQAAGRSPSGPERQDAGGPRRRQGGRAARLVALLLGSAMLTAPLAGMVRAEAVQPGATQRFEIPAQPLGAALAAFVAASGWEVGYGASAVAGLRSSAVSGTLPPGTALRQLLGNSGLQVLASGPTTVALVAPEAATGAGEADLDPITIAALGSTTEGTGSYTTGAMSTGVKLPLSVRETPQTVTVVTRQKIEDAGYRRLDQAVADTPGLVANQNFGDARYQYWSRGLIVDNMQYDGVANPVQYYARDSDGADDMDMYDRVEVLRGASGLVTGAGNPSGAINLIRKRPLDGTSTTLTSRFSSWGNAEAVIDHSTPLNRSGSLRGRFVGSYGGGAGEKEDASSEEGMFYGTIEADLGPATTVNLGYSYQKEKLDGYDWGGLPVQSDGSFYDFSSGDFLGHDWQYLDRSQHVLFADLQHHFDNGWTLGATARAAQSRSEMAASYAWYSGANLYLYDRLFNYDNDVYSFDANVSGPIELFGRSHELVFGVNGSRTDLTIRNALGDTTLVADPLNWDSGSTAAYADFTPYSRLRYQTEQIGAYAAGRFSLGDRLKLIAGSRLSWYDYTGTTTILSTGAVTRSQITENAVFTPYAGAVYDLNDRLSLYASYTSIFQPQYNFGTDGGLLDPITGTNVEAGIKGEFFDARLNATLAAFEVNRDNVASRLSGVSYCNPTIAACYEGIDGVRTRGFELELSGFVTERWRLMGGYTHAVSKYTEGASAGEKFATYQYPEEVLKLYTTYTLPGDRLTLGGGARAQSKLTYKTSALDIKQPGYAVVDLMARYELNPHTALQLNLNNAFDKQYYSALNTSAGYGFFMGAGRSLDLTLTHRF